MLLSEWTAANSVGSAAPEPGAGGARPATEKAADEIMEEGEEEQPPEDDKNVD